MTPELAGVMIVGLITLGLIIGKVVEHMFPTRLDPVDVIDDELNRLHSEMKAYIGGTQNSAAYTALLAEVGRLNQALIDLEMENTKGFNAVQLNESRSCNALADANG